MEEFWADIWFIEGYQVSNYGRIRNSKTGRILIPYENRPNGYLRVNMKGKQYYVHRIVAKVFINRSDDEEYTVIHENGDRTDNSIGNLELVFKNDDFWDRYHKAFFDN